MRLAQFHSSELQPIFTDRLDVLSAEIASQVSSDFTPYIASLKQAHPEKIDDILIRLEHLIYDGSYDDWMNDEYFSDWAFKLWNAPWEQLHAFSLHKNRENNHALRRAGDTIQQRDTIIYRQKATIDQLKTHRAIFAILAAVGIGYSVIDAVIDARREESAKQIHVEPVSPLREL